MTDEELGVLSERDNQIAEAAARLGEDSFRKRVQRMRDRIHSDHGRTAAEQAVDDSFARVSLSRDRTSYRIAGQFDGLRGSVVRAALAREFRWLNNQPELVDGLDGDQAMAQALHDLIRARTATPAQKAALRAMYDGCPISGAPWSQCETHHVVFYRDSGHTMLSELVPISRRWHHLVHEGGWTLTMNPERTLTLSRPDGTTHKTIPYQRPNRTTQTNHPEHALAA